MKATKQGQQFVAKVIELLRSPGAQETEPFICRFNIETKAGQLHVHPTENMGMGIGTVFCRFDNPQRAIALLGPCLNPHSCKWNHFYFAGWTLETALADFTSQIKKVL